MCDETYIRRSCLSMAAASVECLQQACEILNGCRLQTRRLYCGPCREMIVLTTQPHGSVVRHSSISSSTLCVQHCDHSHRDKVHTSLFNGSLPTPRLEV